MQIRITRITRYRFSNIRVFEYLREFSNITPKVMITVSIIFDSRDLDRWAGYGLRRSCVRWINFRTRSLAIRIGVSDTSIRFATSTSSIGIGPPSTRYFTITRVVAGSVARSTFLSMSSPRRSSSTSWASWPPTNSGTNRVDLFIHIIRGEVENILSRSDRIYPENILDENHLFICLLIDENILRWKIKKI